MSVHFEASPIVAVHRCDDIDERIGEAHRCENLLEESNLHSVVRLIGVKACNPSPFVVMAVPCYLCHRQSVTLHALLRQEGDVDAAQHGAHDVVQRELERLVYYSARHIGERHGPMRFAQVPIPLPLVEDRNDSLPHLGGQKSVGKAFACKCRNMFC